MLFSQQVVFVKKSKSKKVEENFIVQTWKSFASQTSFHGVHYLIENSFNFFERSLWMIALIAAFIGTIYTCMLLSNRFRSSLLSTVLESTHEKVTEIPFPAVTFCNNNRYNYTKLNETLDRFCINCNEEQRSTASEFLKIFQNIEWGSFDEFDDLVKRNVSHLKSWNLTELVRFMMHDCDQFFIECEWKKMKFNCCDVISRQKTEYGICWSFNSYSSEKSYEVIKNLTNGKVLKVKNAGIQSALRVKLATLNSTIIERSGYAKSPLGVIILVQHESEWPRLGNFVSAGSRTQIKIKPTIFSTSADVENLEPTKRQCYYKVKCFHHHQIIMK